MFVASTDHCSVSATGKQSREEWRQAKDLDAARKAGTAPAALDEDGNAINPHIPEYITKAPWYADTGKPSLAHQRFNEQDRQNPNKLDEWYDRGAKAGPAAKKYRKGACENCGAMTHKKQDCVERPRKRGAKFTNKDIKADEVIQQINGDYDAKRDRWNGYDASSYKSVMEDYEAVEEARRKMREQEIDAQTSTNLAEVKKVAKATKDDDEDFGSSDEDEEDEDKYAEAADQVGQKLDTKTRVTVRNLRIREDTAKYLINLDAESAYYDPKTRSMRDAPEVGVKPEDVSDSNIRFVCTLTMAADEIRWRQFLAIFW
jgi:pre-mRNA-processing factor SLU7